MLKKGKCIILIIIWSVFIGANGFCYLQHYIRTLRNRMCAENYYIQDSVWTPGDSKWHEDTILYTLFKGKNVYVNPDSWYAAYVDAFADKVIWDENVDAMIDREAAGQNIYTQMNHMALGSHSTLFEEDVWEALTSGQEGISLFIEEESVYLSDNIILFHDKNGNIYLKGADSEE